MPLLPLLLVVFAACVPSLDSEAPHGGPPPAPADDPSLVALTDPWSFGALPGFDAQFGSTGLDLRSDSDPTPLRILPERLLRDDAAVARIFDEVDELRWSPDRGRFDQRFGSVKQWWVIGGTHIEHGFDLAESPPGLGPIRIELKVEGGGVERSGRPDEAFIRWDGGARLRYAGLVAWDAEGTILPSALTVSGPDELTLLVDDTDAIWPIVVDPTLTVEQAWTVAQGGASYGSAVAGVGDVNGDGYDDFATSAPAYDGLLNQLDRGLVHLFYGSATGPGSMQDWTRSGSATSMYLGSALAGGGDLNGDGFGDLLVGSSGYTNGQANEGLVEAYFGSAAGPPTTAGWRIEGGIAGLGLGTSIAGAGDVDADGDSEILVGEPNYDGTATNIGRARLFLGSTSGPATAAHRTWAGSMANGRFGEAVAGIGDGNADGFDDVAVGEPGYGTALIPGRGRVSVFAGGVTGAATSATQLWTGTSADDAFGSAVGRAGDTSGDGYADVVIGAPGYDTASTGGALYLVDLISSSFNATAALVATGNSGSELGSWVDSAGDRNGDGFADIVAGAPGYSTNRGRITVLHGGSSGPLAAVHLDGTELGARFGQRGAFVGDNDGDGLSDLVVGAPLDDGSYADAGRVTRVPGVAAPFGPPLPAATGSQSGQALGASLAWAGDIDGDGRDDLLVGAPGTSNGEAGEGAVHLYLGTASGLAAAAAWSWEGNVAGAACGSAVSGGHDLDGDGGADFAVGCPLQSSLSSGEGRVVVFSGGPAPAVHRTLLGTQAGERLGARVLVAPDLDDNGVGELITLSSHHDGGAPDGGRVLRFAGQPSGLATGESWSFVGTQAGLGASIALAAGDLGSNLVPDLVLGFPTWTNGQAQEGRVLVFPAGPAGLPSAASISWESNSAGAQLGASLAVLPDRSGDGRDDLVVGRPGHGSTQAGAVALHLGTAGGLSTTAQTTWTGTISQGALGSAVLSLGDIDHDGLGDFAASAPLAAPAAAVTAGRLYVVDATDNTLSGATALDGSVGGELLGTTLAAGDWNGDGAVDLALSRPGIAVGGAWSQVPATGGDAPTADPGARGYGGLFVREGALTPPLARGARAGSTTVELSLWARPVQGRASVRVESERDPAGTAWTGTGLTYGAWGQAPVTGGALSASHLLAADERATIRARLQGRAASGWPQSRTPWRHLGNDAGAAAPHLRGPCGALADFDGDGACDPTDLDDDGDASADTADCAPLDASRHPGEPELVADGVDQDCSGGDLCFADADHDAHGTSATVVSADLLCTAGAGESALADDCDDNAADIHPGAPAVCDGVDNGCSASFPTPPPAEVDGDADGFLACAPFIQRPGSTLLGGADCAPSDTSRHPGAPEICDTIDQDCDLDVAEAFPDFDTDGQIDCVDADDDGDGDPDSTDCADFDSAVRHGAAEVIADGQDQDCDGVDLCWLDADGDGFGGSSTVPGIDLSCNDPQRVANDDDCDDTRSFISPAAAEVCDGWDDRCASGSPTPSASSTEADADGDGFLACTGYVARGASNAAGLPILGGDDCGSLDTAIHPGATELCDATDSDCDGSTVDTFPDHDGDASPDCVDPDDDGDGALDFADCASLDAAIHPLAAEIVADGVDQDCSGGDRCYVDADGDGFGAGPLADDDDLDCASGDPGLAALPGDCLDTEGAVFPGAPERCDGYDNACASGGPNPTDPQEIDGDGDLYVSCGPFVASSLPLLGGEDCDDGAASTHPMALEACDTTDQDCDGDLIESFANFDGDTTADCVDLDDDDDGAPDFDDCLPYDGAISPLALESPADGVDQDCSGGDRCFVDLDLDGFGTAATVDDDDLDCGDEPQQSPTDDDCDDGSATVFPGAAESCDAVDADCDGSTVDGASDLDGDGQPDCTDNDDDGDLSPDGFDCAPSDPTVHPGATESCDTVDTDCDGDLVDGASDADLDALPDCTDDDDDGDLSPDVSDCGPFDPLIHPGAAEVCDGVDQDCDGSTLDEGADTDGDAVPDCLDDDDDDDAFGDTIDCGPTEPAVHPGALESCDGLDSDCDGTIVDGAPDTDADLAPDCVDEDDDDDGAGDAEDCGPVDPTMHAGAVESCDGIDSDCDGSLVDEDSDTDDDGSPDCADEDDDDDGAQDGLDCAPLDPAVHPGAVELCNVIDEDCDGSPADAWTDLDGDGAADCLDDDDDGDGAPDEADCRPQDDRVHPQAAEACDTTDQDCDGDLVDGFDDTDLDEVPDCTDPDDDDDGVGDTTDCGPLDAFIHPLAEEACDLVDSDCDGDLVDGAEDSNGDGVPDCLPEAPAPDLQIPPVDPAEGCGTGGSSGLPVLLFLTRVRRSRPGGHGFGGCAPPNR